MVYRKGELSPATMDREWPHQVAVAAEFVNGKNKTIIDRFCRGLSVCPRRHTFQRDRKEYLVYCFADPGDADYFRTYFGGEPMTPETRPKEVGRRQL
ncbi:MAG: hypothetical protein HC869_07520 [Rhodospirillales bacterium]|nr:hypothetical protein [Rhodospirillales bacterium]